MNSGRTLALSALTRWRNGTEFADRIVDQTFLLSGLDASDRGFALELFYGVLRNLTLLDFWIGRLRPKPIDAGARDLLRLGLYQIMFLRTPAHAAVFETVELARPRVRNLINAILRRALREEIILTNAADAQSLPVRFSEPEFLVEKWTAAIWPVSHTRTLPMEQPARADLRAGESTEDDGRRFSASIPGELRPSGKRELCRPAGSYGRRGEWRRLHPGPEHRDRL